MRWFLVAIILFLGLTLPSLIAWRQHKRIIRATGDMIALAKLGM